MKLTTVRIEVEIQNKVNLRLKCKRTVLLLQIAIKKCEFENLILFSESYSEAYTATVQLTKEQLWRALNSRRFFYRQQKCR